MIDTSLRGWSGDLFATHLAEALDASRDLRRDQRLALVREPGEEVRGSQVLPWVDAQLTELEQHVRTLAMLFNSIGAEMFGIGGQPPDVATIEVVARETGLLYRDMLRWSLRAYRVNAPPCYRTALDELALLPENVIARIEQLGPELQTRLQKVRSTSDGRSEIVIPIDLSVVVPTARRVQEALTRAVLECG